jgi:hypothetical protein
MVHWWREEGGSEDQ